VSNRIDDMNYYNDPRTKDAPELPEGLPTKWAICPVCDGKETVVNPSIDSGGLTAEEFCEDPDFREDYLTGVYDIPCKFCKGNGKLKVIDEDACDPETLREYQEDRQAEAESHAEHMAELRMGA